MGVKALVNSEEGKSDFWKLDGSWKHAQARVVVSSHNYRVINHEKVKMCQYYKHLSLLKTLEKGSFTFQAAYVIIGLKEIYA